MNGIRTLMAAILLAAALLAAGCGGSDEQDEPAGEPTVTAQSPRDGAPPDAENATEIGDGGAVRPPPKED